MTSREKILQAAISVFAAKGRYGGHMELIADKASINKAMIYYIFRSKDELYKDVVVGIIEDLAREMIGQGELLSKRCADPEDAVSSMTEFLFFLFADNAEYTSILMDAIGNGMDEIRCGLDECRRAYGDRIEKSGIGNLLGGDPENTIDTDFASIVGMVFSCFAAKAAVSGRDGKENGPLYERMKSRVIDFALHRVKCHQREKAAIC